jgi:hypothetical protein
MVKHLRTNATLNLMRGRAEEPIATDIQALVLPETRAEVLALRGEDTPAAQLFHIICKDKVNQVQQGDQLVDGSTSYRVSSWSHFETPRAAHTEVTAEGKIGT